MTELMTVTDVEIVLVPSHYVHVCCLCVQLGSNSSIHQINYTANIINITTFQGMFALFWK